MILPDATASIFKLLEPVALREYSIIVLGSNGRKLISSTSSYDPGAIETRYQELATELNGRPERIIRGGLLRRVGHFQRKKPVLDSRGCRRFSFKLENCDEALLAGISQWWDANAENATAILYDTESNPWYEDTILAFAEIRQLYVCQVADFLKRTNDPSHSSRSRCYALLVDVVDTADTLLRHIRSLNRRGIPLCTHILAAISDGYKREIEGYGKKFTVTSLAEMKQVSMPQGQCDLCKLKIPHDSDLDEKPDQISSYDFWWMAEHAGWEPEPHEEVPTHGLRYDLIPKFPKILEEFGDWLALKIERRLSMGSRPVNFFLLHPDEASSNALSEKLRLRYRKEIVAVAVPRQAISQALSERSWENVLKGYAGDTWVKHLETLKHTSGLTDAIILDMFNASGRKFGALYLLLNMYELKPFCYFSFVDRDLSTDEQRYPIQKLCPYEWYGPREIMGR